MVAHMLRVDAAEQVYELILAPDGSAGASGLRRRATSVELGDHRPLHPDQ